MAFKKVETDISLITERAVYRKTALPRKPTGRDKVTTRPVKERQTLTEMSCEGVKVWYNNANAKTAVFGLQPWERDG